MKRILFTLLISCLSSVLAFGQGPKWVPNAKKAVFSIMTFDKEDNLLKTGNGFFISETGVGVSDFNLFKGAHKAVVIDTEGKKYPVYSILGADDTYDVVKFLVDLEGKKKVDHLMAVQAALPVGAEVLVLPYSVKKDRICYPGKVKSVDVIRGDRTYYTLDLRMQETLESCPVVNTDGAVIGLLQKDYGESNAMISHVVGINFINDLKVGALSFTDPALQDIFIKKGLPTDENEALVYLYVNESNLSIEDLASMYKDFIRQFPTNSEGYIRYAQYLLSQAKSEADIKEVKSTLDKAYDSSSAKDEALFSIVKFISSNQQNELLTELKGWTIEDALAFIDQAIAINPLPIYMQVKAELLANLGRVDEAIAAYAIVNSSDIASSLSFYNAAQLFKQQEAKPEEILALLDSSIVRLPKPYTFDASPYLFDRALLLIDMGKHREALKDLNEYYYAVEGGVNANFFYIREQVALAARLFQQALDDIELAIQIEPTNTLYLLERASLNLRVGRYDEALSQIEDVIKLDPASAEAYRLQGVTYIQMKDKRACDSLKKAKELGDTLADDLIIKHCK